MERFELPEWAEPLAQAIARSPRFEIHDAAVHAPNGIWLIDVEDEVNAKAIRAELVRSGIPFDHASDELRSDAWVRVAYYRDRGGETLSGQEILAEDALETLLQLVDRVSTEPDQAEEALVSLRNNLGPSIEEISRREPDRDMQRKVRAAAERLKPGEELSPSP